MMGGSALRYTGPATTILSAEPQRFKEEERMVRGARRTLFAAVLLAAGLHAIPAAEDPDKKAPPTSAEKIAGRWRITLEGLPIEHQEILASLAVDGEMLIGTLNVGRDTVNIASGRVVGTDFAFSFTHVTGEVFKMKGSAGERGLEGTWEARNEKGKWRAARQQT
jgi:hypothetical protein